MSNLKNILTFSGAFFILSLIALGQPNSSVDSTTIYTKTVFQPFLTNAFKIKNNPSINDTDKIIPKLKYSFLNKRIPVNFEIDPIKAAKIKGEPLVKLYRGYTKVGFGTNVTPLAELYFNSKRSKNLSYGFSGKHFSSKGINNNDFSRFSDNELNVFAKHFSKEFTTSGKIGYSRNINHYYGFPEDSIPEITETDNIKQELDKFNIGFGLTRNFTDTNQFDYNFDMNFYNINDRYQVSENHFELDGELSKYHKRELYAIGVEMNYNNLINSLDQERNLVVSLNPHISTTADKWHFKVGIGLFVNAYKETKFHFYPKAEFKYNVVDHLIIPYIGIKGGLISNNLDNFYRENPFVNTQLLSVQNTNQKYDIYAGIRGSLSSKITFNTSFSRQKIDGLPLYVHGFNNFLENQFILEYDTVKLSKITGELAYQKLEKIKILLGANYYKYSLKNEIKAWHRPEVKISLSGIYDLSNKIIVRADFYYLGKQYAKTINSITVNNVSTTVEGFDELKGIFDINLGLEYRYTKKLSAFIQFNNIVSRSYQRWGNYPTQRFGVLGGLTYSF